MNNLKKYTSLIIALALIFCLSFSGCTASVSSELDTTTSESSESQTSENQEIESDSDDMTEAADVAEENEIDSSLNVNVMVLNGTTGFGMAKLISESANGSSKLNYTFSVETDASNITAALINGSTDIAALPTNAASAVYNKTDGAVQCLALNTLGVLYLVTTDGTEISSIADLEGMTVYCPAQNPTYIFSHICAENDVEVSIDNTYAQPADLRTAVASGEVSIAVLPEPMVTMAVSANENVSVQLDLTEEWDKVCTPGSLVQGCVVVRTEFANEHPNEVAAFLDEYKASIEYLSSGDADIASVIEESGVFANGAVAVKAIPNCNVCFITGENMKDALSDFLETMYLAEPSSIGGAVPGDDFYYIGQ